jgi:hypothetical protein
MLSVILPSVISPNIIMLCHFADYHHAECYTLSVITHNNIKVSVILLIIVVLDGAGCYVLCFVFVSFIIQV